MRKLTKLGIIAGGGNLPKQVISFCKSNNIPFFVVVLDSHADKELVSDEPHMVAKIGEVGKILKSLKQEDVKEIMLIGSVKRPALSEIVPDWEGVKLIAKLATKAFGDDKMLRVVISELEKKGFSVIGVEEVLPDILAKSGVYGKHIPSMQDMIDIEHGIKIASQMGELDVGQGAVIQEGITLAVEAIEGTDEMIKRAGVFKRGGKGPVFVKVKKPNQEKRADLPTIGKDTIINAAAQGFAGIAIQAGGVLVVDMDEVIKIADEKGLFIIGMDMSNDKER